MRKEENEDQMVKCCFGGTITYIPVKLFQEMTARMNYSEKKFIRYKEGARMYSMSEREFNKLAHNARAVYKLNKMALVKPDIIDEYMEYFRE